ncbi:MAG: DNA topoisomerase IV subunit A [Deltaproteobacteria bacterium]|nr:DNA topoisomerase IV subunit A [Deltaproteobacteria bacterium]MDD9826891.1 DNA topoisomerase IV subunit A [Deltaproteobacteria bacterium]MDD9853760.1 DNA topoisomerase IV subunit A [Deltaproteobacteria bacterium]
MAARKTQKQPAKAPAQIAKRNEKMDQLTLKLIRDTATGVHRSILRRNKPDLSFPIRSLGNVSYSQKRGYFEIGKQKKTRTLTVNTVKNFAQTLRMMGLSKELVENNDFATKRDAYYQSKNWEEAKFDEQSESDTVMDDIEALFSIQGLSREQLRFVPDEHGGAVAGNLVVMDPDRETGEVERIDCTRFGSGAYSIPSNVELLSFQTDAKFVLAIETGGVFQRLQSHKFWQTANCILVSMAGVPTRATRRFIRKLSDECKLPVYAFVDCDPYGISNIYRTLKVGSGNAAHLSQFFCVPQAHYLGVTPQDIRDYDLPTHPLQAVDVKRARDALKNDPFFQAHKPWRKALNDLLKMGVRAEQQALAKWGLNYVIEEYLPRKLAAPAKFLP